MSVADLIQTLRSSSVFADLPDEPLQEVAGFARQAEFRAREVIFEEDSLANEVFLITEGRVALVICMPQVGCRQIQEVSSGDLIGWSPLLHRARLSNTARTLTPTKVLAFDAEKMLALCEANPRFGFDFMQRTASALAERLNALRFQLLEAHGHHLPEVGLESD